jgi:C1A family cysteine protease
MTKSIRLWIYATLAAIMMAAMPGAGSADEGALKDLPAVKCKDVMRVGGAERDIAVAFIHGYLTGKAGKTKIDTDAMHAANEKFVEHCLDNPEHGAINAMEKLTQ